MSEFNFGDIVRVQLDINHLYCQVQPGRYGEKKLQLLTKDGLSTAWFNPAYPIMNQNVLALEKVSSTPYQQAE